MRDPLWFLFPFAAAAAVGVYLLLGGDLEFWIFLLSPAAIALFQLRRQSQMLRRYEARSQFECRVQIRKTDSSNRRSKWTRALATPYPDRLTLQLLEGTLRDSDPLTLQRTEYAGMRPARFSEALLRYNPRWSVAVCRRGPEEILVAAPPSHLAALSGTGQR
ncbi:hypothetical protein [Arthrobacter sp. G119Y2]|uniref:hypothetical protein n=1 Tax=Arthrobacter sp. G119Y2 TaxID=3134965 RepID=UPI00311A5692